MEYIEADLNCISFEWNRYFVVQCSCKNRPLTTDPAPPASRPARPPRAPTLSLKTHVRASGAPIDCHRLFYPPLVLEIMRGMNHSQSGKVLRLLGASPNASTVSPIRRMLQQHVVCRLQLGEAWGARCARLPARVGMVTFCCAIVSPLEFGLLGAGLHTQQHTLLF